MQVENKDNITSINGIKFTPREIDIISCIISGRNVKSISQLFNISTRTTESHIQSIKQKFECNSKDLIARITEKSPEYDSLIENYQNIYKHELLNEIIKKIKPIIEAEKVFVTHNLLETDTYQKFITLLKECGIRIDRDTSTKELHINVNRTNVIHIQDSNEISLLCSVIDSFCRDNDVLMLVEKLQNKNTKTEHNVEKKSGGLKYIIILFLVISGVFGTKFYFDKKDLIMSNMYYASDNMIVRASLLRRIEQSIENNKNAIKLIVITGRGGAGKTTIARNFVDDRSANIKWEINAESKQTIINSFDDLASVFADKHSKQEELSSIRSVSNPDVRNKKIMSFVQSCLKEDSNWYLLFDNIDDLEIVKEYFPLNSEIWGRGIVLITTRNKNIGKSDLFSCSTVPVGHLSADEQYQLFCNILYGDGHDISSESAASIRMFLSKIPMFPLDVSSAAYYIKNTNIGFDNYLSHVHSFSEDFENIHKKVISEYMEYNETRNGIITSIFNKIIQENPDFIELLLFMCVVDSQNIPLRFFEAYKDKTVAREFRYTLRRFSMVMEKSDTFSIHRSTQEIGLKYVFSLLSIENRVRILDRIVKVMTPYGGMLVNRYDKQEYYLTKLEQKSISQHARFFIKNIESMEIDKKKKDEYKAKLLLSILYAHRTIDNFSEALIPIADEIFKINKDGLYIKGHDFAALQLESIYYHFSIKDYFEGEKKLKKVVALCDEIKADSLKVIAFVYFAQFYCEKNNFEKCQQYLDRAKSVLDQCHGQMAAIASVVLATRYQICYLYHYICGEKLKIAVASFEDALERMGASTLFYKSPEKYKNLSRVQLYMVPNARKRLANVYNHLEMYDKAWESEKEAAFFYENEETFNPIGMLVKIDEGYTLLRTNKVKEAQEVLSKTIKIKQKLGASQDMLEAQVWLSEANIRLNKFEEAYGNCQTALKLTKKSKTNFAKLLKILCYYNMAIIRYKQNNQKESIEHYNKFFELSKPLCCTFLDKASYEKLLNENAFEIVKDESQIKICLQNSLKIFSVIYGKNHSFVRDYVSKID